VVLSFGSALRPNSLKATLKTLGQKTGPYTVQNIIQPEIDVKTFKYTTKNDVSYDNFFLLNTAF